MTFFYGPLHMNMPVLADQQGLTYITPMLVVIGYSLEDLPGVIDKRDRWRKRVKEICADCTPYDDNDFL